MSEEKEVPEFEPQYLKKVSNAQEIAQDFNTFVIDQDFELNDIEEDLAEGAANSIIIEHIQSKHGTKWNDNKQTAVLQSLQKYVSLSQQQSFSKEADNNEPFNTQRSLRESNADILNQIIQIAPLKETGSTHHPFESADDPITYPSGYKDIRFSDYHFEHLAQFIYDDTEQSFHEDGKACDLYHIISDQNIDGKALRANLDESYIKTTFNNHIHDKKHKFKTVTIQYIIEANQNGDIHENWDSDTVFKFLYFAECNVIRDAIRSLEIDGKTFIMIDTKEWSKQLKQFGIPLSVSQGYYTRIETHKMNSALSLQRTKSNSISIKYDEHKDKLEQLEALDTYAVGGLKVGKHVGFNVDPTELVMTPEIPLDEEEEHKHSHFSAIDPIDEESSVTDPDEDINTVFDAFDVPNPAELYGRRHGKYPIYINKALFHVSDDENLEVLVDEAVIKLLSFNELWQDADFVKSLYHDLEFSGAVKQVYDILAAAYEKEKFGFFEEFVSKQYAREIQEHALQMERFYDENDEEALIDHEENNEDHNLLNKSGTQWCFEVDQNGNYTICDFLLNGRNNKQSHKINVKQNPEGFSWAMFKNGKRVKTLYNRTDYHGGYWWICDEEMVGKEIHEWHSKLSDIQKRRKQKMQAKKKNKVKKWVGPSIPLKHLNIILGLVNHHYCEMLDPNKRRKIWKKKRKKEPIFAKFLPREMYEKPEDDDGGGNISDDPDEKQVLDKDDEEKKQKEELFISPDIIEKKRRSQAIQITNLELADRRKASDAVATNSKSIYGIFKLGADKSRMDYVYDEKEEEAVHLKIIDDDGREYIYDLFWWNSESRSKVNAFCIKRAKDIDFKWQHYLYFRTNYYDLLKWEWYDNDQAEYMEYEQHPENVLKQLEATFQSNIQENFPIQYFHLLRNEHEPMFNYCQLPDLERKLSEKGVRVGMGFVLRFSFTKNNRISNIEQLSVWKDNPEFARNVRRMYDGKNSLYTYFKDKNEYIEEWKRLYLLDTDEQQKFFWSHIITVCAAMKYINIEFENQMVSFAFERVSNLDSSILSQMDFNDVQREIRDMISWDGFLIPPTNLFQTNDVRMDENDLTDEAWFKKQGYATILTQWHAKHFQRNKKAKHFKTRIKSRQNYCGHDIDPRYQTYWQTTTGYTYCDSCAKLLQFAECIRKFVLEYENDEVVELLWPWYRNTFHSGSSAKYGKYINKYNLSHLYMEYDLLPDFVSNNSSQNVGEYYDGEDGGDDEDPLFRCFGNYKAGRRDGDGASIEGDESVVPHIRHRRKFAAQLLLGGWDTLRNLNIIRQQLLPIMEAFITSEIVDEETHIGDGNRQRRAIEKHKLKFEFKEEDYLSDRRFWWIDKIGTINAELRVQIEENDWKTLFNFEHHDSLEIKQQHAVVFNEFLRVFVVDDRETAKLNDPDQFHKDYPDEYFRTFLEGVSRTPSWWGLEHDTLLLELALRFNYSSDEFLKELTGTKKRYYQYRLRSKIQKKKSNKKMNSNLDDACGDIEEDDTKDNIDVPVPFIRQMSGRAFTSPATPVKEEEEKEELTAEADENEEIGYQEFKAWCQVDENIMHRLKYITFLLIQKLAQCSPSIIDLRIPSKQDQPTFEGISYVFLNDYMRTSHHTFCRNYESEPDGIKEVAGTLCEASKYITAHRQNWKQIQKDLQVCGIPMGPGPIPMQHSMARKRSTEAGVLFKPQTSTMLTEMGRAKLQQTMRNVMKSPKNGGHGTGSGEMGAGPSALPPISSTLSYNHTASMIGLGGMGSPLAAVRSQMSLADSTQQSRSGIINKRRGHFSRTETLTNLSRHSARTRTRDPFLRRDLARELQEVVQSFDLLLHGELMAHFIIKLLKTKQLPSLWLALGVLLRIIPYKLALQILHESRGELRHGDPADVAKVCREVMEGSNFLVPAALYLAEFMEKNAEEDLAREEEWREYSKYYERIAQQQINSIESDHLLGVLLDIPIYIRDLNLLQLALERDRIQFLNNERINGVMSHVWYASAFLDPIEDIEKGNQNWMRVFTLLFQRPFQFYLTPMGFNWTTGLCYIGYLFAIAIYVLYDPVYPQHAISYEENLLWICNVGYILNEVLEWWDQGRQYFAVNGLLNYFDIMISLLWMILLAIRIHSYSVDYTPYSEANEYWYLSRIYTTLWAVQLVLLCFRSLGVVLSSQYIGILFRMLELMMGQIVRFGFFIGTIVIGFLFGLYYIDNIPNRSDNYDEKDDIYQHFLYLFTSLVGMAEVETHLKVDNEDPMLVVSQVYSIFFIIFATILSMNLLIALMTAEFDRVRSRANTEYAYARAELTYDLSHRNRFMAPPLNIFVLFVTIFVHIANFLPAILFPDTLNIYYYLATGHYHALRNFNILDYIKICLCCFNNKRRKKIKKKNKRRKKKHTILENHTSSSSSLMSFESEPPSLKRGDIMSSTCGDRFCGTIFCCCKCEWECLVENKTCRRWHSSRKKKSNTFLMNTTKLVLKYYFPSQWLPASVGKRTQWNVYHDACYNCIAKQRIDGSKFESHAFHGIAMNQYFNIYEAQRKTKLDALDKNLLKHLTINTLFCQYCFRPFDIENMESQLITPFWALADIISCYAFFFFVWWALILLIGFIAIFSLCKNSCRDDLSTAFSDDYGGGSGADGSSKDRDEFREYDREYWGSTSHHIDFAELKVAS